MEPAPSLATRKIERALDVVDEHREQIPDGAYKSIAEGLQALHKEAHAETRQLYDAEWMLVRVEYRFDDESDGISDVEQRITRHRALLRTISADEWNELRSKPPDTLLRFGDLFDRGMIHESTANMFTCTASGRRRPITTATRPARGFC